MYPFHGLGPFPRKFLVVPLQTNASWFENWAPKRLHFYLVPKSPECLPYVTAYIYFYTSIEILDRYEHANFHKPLKSSNFLNFLSSRAHYLSILLIVFLALSCIKSRHWLSATTNMIHFVKETFKINEIFAFKYGFAHTLCYKILPTDVTLHADVPTSAFSRKCLKFLQPIQRNSYLGGKWRDFEVLLWPPLPINEMGQSHSPASYLAKTL